MMVISYWMVVVLSSSQISFDDGTCRQVPVKKFAEDTKVEFKHSLTSSMDPEEFAKQFEKDLETLKKTGMARYM